MSVKDFAESLLAHTFYSVRVLRRNPAFALTAILSLGIGIGTNIVMFGVLQAVLLEPLPHVDSQQLVMIEEVWPTGPGGTSYLNFIELRRRLPHVSGLAALRLRNVQILQGDEARRLPALEVTANYFEVLRERPLIGRYFAEGEDVLGAQRVAVLSEDLWRNFFGADRSILGRSILVDGEPNVVIGVAPQTFRPDPFPFTRLWTTMQPVGQLYTSGAIALSAFARLRPGTTVQAANSELATIMDNIREANPSRLDSIGKGARMIPMQRWEARDLAVKLPILTVGTVSLLALVCVNLANLLLAWTIARKREWATRLALGCTPWQVAEQMLALSGVLAVIGLTVAFLLQALGFRALHQVTMHFLPYGTSLGLSLPMMLYAVFSTVVTMIAFGTVPALVAANSSSTVLRSAEHTSGASRWQRTAGQFLIILEICLSTALVCSAGLMFRTLYNLEEQDLGLNLDNVMVFRTAPTNSDLRKQHVIEAYYMPMLQRLSSLPGVESVSATTTLPIYGGAMSDHIQAPGHPISPAIHFSLRGVMPNYFRSLGITMARGREFGDEDRVGTLPVAVINDVAARLVFGNEDPIGQQIGWGNTIIGVYKSTAQGLRSEARLPEIDLSLLQLEPNSIIYETWAKQPLTIFLRTSVPPMTLREVVRQTVEKIDSGQRSLQIQTLRNELDRSLTSERLLFILISLFGGIALSLAAVGVYGLMSYRVTQRRGEIGIRMALGATPRSIRYQVVREAWLVSGLGLILGYLMSLGAATILRASLYRVSSHDPLTFITVGVAIGLIATLAAFVPAQRAASADPSVVLRQE